MRSLSQIIVNVLFNQPGPLSVERLIYGPFL